MVREAGLVPTTSQTSGFMKGSGVVVYAVALVFFYFL